MKLISSYILYDNESCELVEKVYDVGHFIILRSHIQDHGSPMISIQDFENMVKTYKERYGFKHS